MTIVIGIVILVNLLQLQIIIFFIMIYSKFINPYGFNKHYPILSFLILNEYIVDLVHPAGLSSRTVYLIHYPSTCFVWLALCILHCAKCMCCKVHVLQSSHVVKCMCCYVQETRVPSNPHYILHFPSYTLHLIHFIFHIPSDTLHKSLKPSF